MRVHSSYIETPKYEDHWLVADGGRSNKRQTLLDGWRGMVKCPLCLEEFNKEKWFKHQDAYLAHAQAVHDCA